MRIKLSQSEWRGIGRRAGWLKRAGWSGRSDEGPPDQPEGHWLEGEELEMPFEDMDIDDFPGVAFSGTYVIRYDYQFPTAEWDDDEVMIEDIWVKEVRCEPFVTGAECPSDAVAAAAVRRELIDPRNGFPHKDDVREHARERDDRPDPDDYEDTRGL